MPGAMQIALSVVVAAAAWSDFRTRKIPNWITAPGAALGLILHVWFSGLPGALESVLGAMLGLAIFLGLYIAGGMGAGDVKLFGAVGAFAGPQALIIVFVFTGLFGGAAALALALARCRLRQTLANTGNLMMDLGRFRWQEVPQSSVALPSDALRLPYGVVIGV